MNNTKLDNEHGDSSESPELKLKQHISIAEMRFQTPERQPSRLLPWLMIMLTLIAAAGFWLQYDAWMDSRWFRSTVINLGIKIQPRDKDWQIIHTSIQPSWITRSDRSKALLIKGEIQNLLSSYMLAPNIKLTFFSNTVPNEVVNSQLLPITYIPTQKVIMQSPYHRPNIDNKEIPALGKRQFVFLIDKLPQGIGDFSLSVKSRQKHVR